MLRWLLNLFAPRRALDSGGQGEQLAAEWLRRNRGFSLVAKNWRSPRDRRDEIDIICRDGAVLVFVEVKARSGNALVPGYYAVDARKKRVIKRAAQSYLSQLSPKPTTFRFDVVEVSFPKAADGAPPPEPQILHFENVPLFEKHYRG